MTKNSIPDGVARLSPYLIVQDADATIKFYQDAFGFVLNENEHMKGPDGKTQHASMSFHGATIMFGPEGAFGGTNKSPKSSGVESPVSLYVYCDDVDAIYKQATNAGAESIMPPEDMFWGDRMTKLIDINGHSWSFATKVGEFDPSKIPQ